MSDRDWSLKEENLTPEEDVPEFYEAPEELEELEELEEEDFEPGQRLLPWALFRDLPEELRNADLLSHKSIRQWINRNKMSLIPVCLLDLDLKILWTNLEYLKHLTFRRSPVNRSFPDLFKTEHGTDISILLRSHLENAETAHSWSGRLYPVADENSSTFLRAMIQPVLYADDEIPHAFSCHWDIITPEFKDMLQKTFFSLLEASKLKDNDTGNHIARVNSYCRLMSTRIKGMKDYPEVNDAFIEDIAYLAAMHDVGKIGTPDDILNKEGPLDEWEREIMNEHTKNGAYILSTYPNPMAREIALSHHERWDGTGYPYGIFGRMIPVAARIVAVADVYDALRARRSYKDPFGHEETVRIIEAGRGSHFDPSLVDLFLEIQTEFEEIFEQSRD